MAAMTIRNLDDALKQRLRMRAATHGRSMEEEAREILRAALDIRPGGERGLALALFEESRKVGGVELELPVREGMHEPPDFGGPEFNK